jgi:hypothetical protein
MNNELANEEMMVAVPTAMAAPDALQPLREIGCDEKTQYWDLEDIQAALREALRLGIDPQAPPLPPAA